MNWFQSSFLYLQALGFRPFFLSGVPSLFLVRSHRHPLLYGERSYISPRRPAVSGPVIEGVGSGSEGGASEGGHEHLAPPPHMLGYGSVARGRYSV